MKPNESHTNPRRYAIYFGCVSFDLEGAIRGPRAVSDTLKSQLKSL
jgi:hypothetical protein